MDSDWNTTLKINKVETLPDAMSLFRNSRKRCENYYVVSLGKIIEMKLVRNRIIFNEMI